MNGLTLPTKWSDHQEMGIRALMLTQDEIPEAEHGLFHKTGLEQLFRNDTECLWEVLARTQPWNILKRQGWGQRRLLHIVGALTDVRLQLGMSPDDNILVLEARRRLAERA